MDRFTARFCNIMKDEYPEMFEKDSKKRLSPEMINQALSADGGLEAGEFGTDKVIDMMMVYYDVSYRNNILRHVLTSPDVTTYVYRQRGQSGH